MSLVSLMRVRVIYIDDSQAELQAVREALGTERYDLVTRTNAEGLEDDVRGADIVLIDYHMPGTTGAEMLKTVRGMCLGETSKPFFYLYTTDREVGGEYREMGFDGRFILKGNQDALRRQMDAAAKAVTLRRLRPA